MAKGDIKNRREVERLSASLSKDLSEKHSAEALRSNGHAYIGAKKGWCDVCAEEFDSTALWNNKRKKIFECPHCGAKLAIKRSPNKYVSDEKYYFSTVTIVEGWQVITTYLCKRYSTRSVKLVDVEVEEPKVSFSAWHTFQWWIKPDGTKPLLLSYGVSGLTYYVDQWNFFSRYEFRKEGYQHRVGGWIGSGAQLLPILKRNGLKKLFEFHSLKDQMFVVIANPKAEILLKRGANALFEQLLERGEQVNRYWPSIRVALRHGYLPKDARTWLDHLHLLEQRNQDLRNPVIICPKDLKKAHQVEVERENRRREIRRAEADRRIVEENLKRSQKLLEELSADGKAQIEYVKRMGNMLGVMVKVGDIELRPLQSIQEFYEEGMNMHHCVFTNKYYEHDHTLILSARVNGERTETVEVNTRTWQIAQCRAKHNGISKHHDDIIKVVEENMSAFRRYA